jgi:hypothetical protein
VITNGITPDSEKRLRKAVKMEVRRNYEQELRGAKGWRERLVVEQKIREEIAKRFGQVASPYSLWFGAGVLTRRRFGSEP